MNVLRLTLLLFCLAIVGASAQPVAVNISVNTDEGRKAISPYIYGNNAYIYDSEWGNGPWKVGLENQASGLNLGSRRLGGNTMTSYNWESGFSNSGNDDNHSNNAFQSYITGAGDPPYGPGAALTTFHGHSLALGAYSLLQLPAAGYVAADANGPADAAPSGRWKEVVFDKPGSPASLTTQPDPNDNYVYVDEEVNFLIDRFGASDSPNGIKGYELDNEPGLWHHYPSDGDEGTHSHLHASLTTCGDVLERTIALAKTIRRMDGTAEVFGPAMWGYPEFYSLWNVYDGTSHYPSDWDVYDVEPYRTNNTGDQYRYNHMTWVNAYLDQVRLASEEENRRLLDVFSVHFYSDAVGSDDARVQAPRSLWDPSFVEDSWITQQGNGFTDGRPLMLLPKLRQSIDDFYPGTKLAITEYSFGGRHNVSGGIAQADALGIFGKEGLYLANYFFPVDDYIAAAFRIYRNYDGKNSTFGETAVGCATSDNVGSSVYASLDGEDRLHIVLINKDFSREADMNVTLQSSETWRRAEAFAFGKTGPEITNLGTIEIAGNAFHYVLPPSTVCHLVLERGQGSAVPAVAERSRAAVSVRPNPCSDRVGIAVILPESGNVTLTLYDRLGRESATLFDGYHEAGTMTLEAATADLAPGMYTVVLGAGEMQAMATVAVVR